MVMFDAEPRQPRRTCSRSVIGANGSRWWRRGHWSIGGVTMTSTTPTDSHSKPLSSSPAFTEKITGGVKEFGANHAMVEWEPHVDGAVEDKSTIKIVGGR